MIKTKYEGFGIRHSNWVRFTDEDLGKGVMNIRKVGAGNEILLITPSKVQMEFVADDQLKLDGNTIEITTPTGYGKEAFSDDNYEPYIHFMTPSERLDELKLTTEELNKIPKNLEEFSIKRIINKDNEIGTVELTSLERELAESNDAWALMLGNKTSNKLKPYNEKWLKTNGCLIKLKDSGNTIRIITITGNNVYTDEYPRYKVRFKDELIEIDGALEYGSKATDFSEFDANFEESVLDKLDSEGIEEEEIEEIKNSIGTLETITIKYNKQI